MVSNLAKQNKRYHSVYQQVLSNDSMGNASTGYSIL